MSRITGRRRSFESFMFRHPRYTGSTQNLGAKPDDYRAYGRFRPPPQQHPTSPYTRSRQTNWSMREGTVAGSAPKFRTEMKRTTKNPGISKIEPSFSDFLLPNQGVRYGTSTINTSNTTTIISQAKNTCCCTKGLTGGGDERPGQVDVHRARATPGDNQRHYNIFMLNTRAPMRLCIQHVLTRMIVPDDE